MPTKILVADDSATMRRVLEMTFAGENATVQAVDGAEAALARIGEFAPDVVFADASMPGVDGYELTRRIKANPQLAKIAVIVMASQQAPYDEARGRAAGVDDHVSKPFDTQSLIDRTTQVLARPRATAASAEGVKAAAPPARPAAQVNAAASGPGTGTSRVPPGTRMGIGGPVPMQAAQAKAAAPQPLPAPRPAAPPPAPAVKPAAPPPAPARSMPAAAQAGAVPAGAVQAGAVQAATQDLGGKLAHLGLSREQLEGVLALSREVIEQVVWEVVPDLAEQLIKEEIKRLTAE